MPCENILPKPFKSLGWLVGVSLVLNVAAARGQIEQSDADNGSPLVPDGSLVIPNQNPSEQIPAIPQPPPLKDRPGIPTPAAVTLPTPPESDTPKPNLSWRAKAYALSNELPSSNASDRLSWSLPASFENASRLLSSALGQTGFQLLGSYPD